MWDELEEPLGLVSGAAAPARVGPTRLTGRAATGAAALALAIGLVVVPRLDRPLGGEPFAVAKVDLLPAPQKPVAQDVTASVREPVAPPIASAEQVEATSGVKVTRGNGGPPEALIIDVQRALGAESPSAQSNPSANP